MKDVTHVVPVTAREVIPIQLVCSHPIELPASCLIGPHLDAKPLEDSLVLDGESVSGDHTVLIAAASKLDLTVLYLFHCLIEANVSKDKAGLSSIGGRDVPGFTSTCLFSFIPGAFKFAIGL